MLLHEDRLEGAVGASVIGLGETVRVTTKMGEHVENGRVKAGSHLGLLLVCSDGEREVENYYSDKFYLFIPEARQDRPVALREDPRKHSITDMSPDDRVRLKLEQEPEGPDVAAGEPEEPEQEVMPDDAAAEPEEPADAENTSVDVEALPDDIKAAIITTKEMDPEGVNTMLTLVGDAAVKGLQKAGVAQTEMLGVAQKIQDAAYAVLTRNGLARDTLKDVKKKKKK